MGYGFSVLDSRVTPALVVDAAGRFGAVRLELWG
jgi:hypothetical protein